MTLALEACGNGVVAQRLFDQSFFRQLLVALHHVANAHRHQQALFEYRAALLGITFILLRVLVFGHIHRLYLHTEPGLEEVVIDDRTGDSHRYTADGKIAFALHAGDR